MKTEEILREAVINITLEKTELQIKLKEATERGDQMYKWWQEEKNKNESLQEEVEKLKGVLQELGQQL